MASMCSNEDYSRVVRTELGRTLRARWAPDEDLSAFEDLLQRLDETSERQNASDS